LESLGVIPAPILGLVDGHFQFTCPADKQWMERLHGRFDVQGKDGFIRAGKLMYKLTELLNLKKMIKNPFQQIKGKVTGMPYQSASTRGLVTNGILEFKDLKIQTPNMDILGEGQIDLSRKTVNSKIRLQFLSSLKESLQAIPGVKIIVRPVTGLIQIPLRIDGPLDDPKIL
jgi:uncharacterized protein YhdP